MRSCTGKIGMAVAVWLATAGGATMLRAQGRFNMVGNARDLGKNCFHLTDEQYNQNGSAWYGQRISLQKPFDVSFEAYFGCLDNGADGITFALQPLSTNVGVAGGGLGILNVSPSIAIEFDTFCNGDIADPAADHIAVIRDGNVDHRKPNTLAGPMQPGINFEDCAYHHVRVTWNPATRNLRVFFDCQLQVNLTYDIVNDIFSGNPNVYWGFTAATGGAYNKQEVCINFTNIIDLVQDTVVCPGRPATLDAGRGKEFLWNTSYGLSDSSIRNPVANPARDTLYIVKINDNCGFAFYDTVRVGHYRTGVQLPPDTTFCKGESLWLQANATYPEYKWSTGETAQKIKVSKQGRYFLTITDSNKCQATDTFELSFLPAPESGFSKEIKYWSASCEDSLIQLQANKGYTSYLWSTADTADHTMFFGEGMLWVTMDNGSCKVTDTIAIKKLCASLLYAPNAFSANADNLNDGWKIVCENCDTLHLKIFNRWGELVFETADLDAAWDGNYKQKPCPAGVYFYMLTYGGYAEGGRIKGHQTGNITLLR